MAENRNVGAGIVNGLLIVAPFWIIVIAFVLFLSGCSPATGEKRNYYYTGASSACLVSDSLDTCTALIDADLQAEEYEKLPVAPENNSDAFYLGFLNHCLKHQPQNDCVDLTDQAISNKYFEQVETVPVYPTPGAKP